MNASEKNRKFQQDGEIKESHCRRRRRYLYVKGGKKQATRADPYAAKMRIWAESTVREEMLIKLHEDGLLLEKQLSELKTPCDHRVPELEEVNYRGFNECIRVTLASYHRSEM